MLFCKNHDKPTIFHTPTMYDLIQGRAHEIGSKHCCYNLYFMKCVILTKTMLCFRSFNRSKKSFAYKHTSDFAYSSLRFKQELRNWSPTLFKFSPPPASTPFCTHAHKQINVVSYHALKSFPSKKNAAVFRAGPLTKPAPPPRLEGSGGGSAGPEWWGSYRRLGA